MTLLDLPPLPRTHRFTREDYYRMAEAGVIPSRHVELMDGEVIDMAPQKDSHALAIVFADYTLRRVFGAGFTIRVQLPFVASEISEPEPDLVVLAGSPRAHAAHPTTALLVVEVAESSLEYDRTRKARTYAASGIPDYWIVNLVDRCVEVYRNAQMDPAQGEPRYAPREVFSAADSVAPLAAPQTLVKVSDFLP